MNAYDDGVNVGRAMALRGESEPAAVSIPSKWMAGPKMWNTYSANANDYARGVGDGYAEV
jgi:hypothetical protein